MQKLTVVMLLLVIATSGIDYNIKFWEPVDKDMCSLEDLKKVST